MLSICAQIGERNEFEAREKESPSADGFRANAPWVTGLGGLIHMDGTVFE